jgi:sec-independent protein translocase protein TatA
MGEMSPVHWAIVIGVAILLFGARRLPDAARSLGRSARILKAEMASLHEDGDHDRATAEPAVTATETVEPPKGVTAPGST